MSEAEVWSVAIAPDNIQTMTLDQLDEAFQKGLITENALVWTDGMDNWERLSTVLGDDAGADAPAPVAAPVVAAPVASPVAVSPLAVAPVAQVVRPAAAPSAPNSLAPVAMAPSLAPSMGLDDLDLDGFATKKKTKWPLFAAAAVLLGGLGFTAANLSSGSGVDASKAAAAAMPIDPGNQPIGSPVPAAAAEEAPLSGGGYKISAAEDAKFKAEEEKEAEQRARVAAALAAKPPEPAPAAKPSRKGGGGHARAQKSSATGGIQKGGSKFDPLNGALP